METDNLYRVEKKDLEKLEGLLTECFEKDPLYEKLIPDVDIRKRLLPELFKCDLEEFFQTCEIYADSEELNGIIVVSDETESYHVLRDYIEEMTANLKTDRFLIKEDSSLKTLWHFMLGKDYLNSKWTDDIHEDKRLHVIYLAVRPSMQHHGISSLLMNEVLSYADQNDMLVSLETHNEKNVELYKHYGFSLFEIVEKHFNLKQYCMVRRKILAESV
ncbi:MAG: GNAT family N-acetyltransferase [Lachnospiraceae bacterium]|nr:GNAT family N-acetyltransferase [Lachnospiraceae bacterium]